LKWHFSGSVVQQSLTVPNDTPAVPPRKSAAGSSARKSCGPPDAAMMARAIFSHTALFFWPNTSRPGNVSSP
jgi:hypothetical protein